MLPTGGQTTSEGLGGVPDVSFGVRNIPWVVLLTGVGNWCNLDASQGVEVGAGAGEGRRDWLSQWLVRGPGRRPEPSGETFGVERA